MRSPARGPTDPVLLVLIGLLAATMVCFLAGWLPYPVGWLVLTFLIAARVMHSRNAARKKVAGG